ncbi:MAG: hypothetical protein AAF830_07875 [Pseudomonadota bacterium]
MNRLFAYVLSALCLAISAASAQSLADRVQFRTLGEFKKAQLDNYPYDDGSCPALTHPLAGKVYGGFRGELSLTEEEYVALVGDEHPFFGLQSGTRFYVRATGKVVEILPAYLSTIGIDTSDASIVQDPVKFAEFQRVAQAFTPDLIPDDTPVLCGDGSEELRMAGIERERREQKAAERAAYEATCEACTMPAGALIQAIYDGDFRAHDRLARQYVYDVWKAGGDQAMAIGVLINMASGAGDLTMLEDMIGYFILSTSRKWGDACYGPGSSIIPFKSTYPEQVYTTMDGIEVGRDPGFSRITEYKVRPKFEEACDELCNRNGGILLTARVAAGFGGTLEAIETFKGIDTFIDRYSCKSPEMVQFEDHLVEFLAEERANPNGFKRNTIASYFR